ncbi:hypothetical protein [Aestuariivivens sediminicola]|uniref:hypothetical protein n=1 Tax=Aestuariivivens sediminicola TaxID=2913560 RepID=UPI001F58029F|nr:hypothetical protein [Aestuariivivens sediminicola]
MRKALSLIVLTVLMACSSNDKEDSPELDQTFLEKYHNTIWLQQDTETQTVYRHFKNDLNDAVVTHYDGPGACFETGEYDLNFDEIMENSLNKLEIKFNYSVNEYQIDTYTFSNGVMTYHWYEFYFGSVTEATYTLVETSLSINNINFCN